jgi:hypothetical protein
MCRYLERKFKKSFSYYAHNIDTKGNKIKGLWLDQGPFAL